LKKSQVKPSATVEQSRTDIKSKYHVRHIHNSPITGERYEWNGAGAIVSVHADDVSTILGKFRMTGCCGSVTRKYFIFEEA